MDAEFNGNFFLQLNNIQLSVSFAQDFLTFTVWKKDEKVILFSFPTYGTTNTRPIFLCCRGPLITVWICNTYRWEAEYKLEYNPCKIRSFLGCFLFFLFCQEIFFVYQLLFRAFSCFFPHSEILKYFLYIKQRSV